MKMPLKPSIFECKGGFSALSSVLMNEKSVGKVIEIGIDRIYPNANQPRKTFPDSDIAELAASIKVNGMIQPVVVRRIDMGYELIAGERRVRAAKMCGYEVVPCIIVETTESGSAMMSLIENVQRKDLHFFEEAEAIDNIIKLFGLTQEDAAVRLGKSQSAISNKLRLLKLNPKERRLITEYGFTERHARALLRIDDEQLRMEVIERIYSGRLNVEGTERLVDSVIKRNEEMKRISKCRGAFRDIRIFINTIDHAVEMMQAAGINAEVRKNREKEFVEYIVRIPNNK
ncbi:MAG: ParB/RepB/Spo0J family partition protein [Huintestinicola sp.]